MIFVRKIKSTTIIITSSPSRQSESRPFVFIHLTPGEGWFSLRQGFDSRVNKRGCVCCNPPSTPTPSYKQSNEKYYRLYVSSNFKTRRNPFSRDFPPPFHESFGSTPCLLCKRCETCKRFRVVKMNKTTFFTKDFIYNKTLVI